MCFNGNGSRKMVNLPFVIYNNMNVICCNYLWLQCKHSTCLPEEYLSMYLVLRHG